MHQSWLVECLRYDGLVPSLMHGGNWEELWDYFVGIWRRNQSACTLPVVKRRKRSLTTGQQCSVGGGQGKQRLGGRVKVKMYSRFGKAGVMCQIMAHCRHSATLRC